MSPAPENDSATAGEEIPKVDLTETHGQDVGDNPGHGSGDDHHHQQTDQGAGEKKPSVLIEATAAKKKSRKRGKNNKNKPTGFEGTSTSVCRSRLCLSLGCLTDALVLARVLLRPTDDTG